MLVSEPTHANGLAETRQDETLQAARVVVEQLGHHQRLD
jgi:hypothetical protein